MKIANIACAWPPYTGGMASSAHQISQLLGERHEVVDYTPFHLKPWLRYGHGAFLPQLLWRLRGFDYIYLHYPFFGSAEIVWLFMLFSRQTRLIIHYHMDAVGLSPVARLLSLPGRLIVRRLFRQAETVVTASLDYVKNGCLKDYYRKHPDKFREIPFGLDLKKFQPARLHRPTKNKMIARAQEMINYVNDKFIKRQRLQLLFVGGLDRAHYFKGIPVLLEALAGLDQERWRLDIVGDGDQRPKYEAQSARLGINNSVHFRGRLDDLELVRAYQNADLFVLPSINSHEAFGIVLTEALACGVPVIASDLPGVRSVFHNFQEGLLVGPGDAADLRKKLQFIFDNEEARREMSRAARRLAENRYDLNKMRDPLNGLFV